MQERAPRPKLKKEDTDRERESESSNMAVVYDVKQFCGSAVDSNLANA